MFVLAVLPIIILIIISLWRDIKAAVFISCICTTLLFFFWGADWVHFYAVLCISAITTIPILMIVLGASFLYNIMSATGLVDQISHSLDDIHASKDIRFFLLAFGLTAFFEGVAGFGTPGAIVPLILIALGFEAILSVSVVLLLDGMFSMFGAVGIPLITGLQIPLKLSSLQTQQIATISAVFVMLAGVVLLFLIFRLVKKQRAPLQHQKKMLLMYSFFAISYCVFAWFVPELATFLSALVMLLLSVLYLKNSESKLYLKPWIPYAILALFLLLPKLWSDLKQALSIEINFNHIFGTQISGSIVPLQSPLIPFLIVGLAVALFKKSESLHINKSFTKVASVSFILFPSIVIAQLMLYSGVTQPSMVNHIADMLSLMGTSYPFFAPLIGVIGTFITGSTTISNLVFGASQLDTAHQLSLNPQVILSLQLAGASLGNGICLFNIIAAAVIANIKNYSGVLANNLLPTLIIALILGVFGMLSMLLVA